MLCRPTSRWNRTTSAIARASTSRSGPAPSSLRTKKRWRASSSSLGRRKLPTWSARNGGVLRVVIGRLLVGLGVGATARRLLAGGAAPDQPGAGQLVERALAQQR